MTGVTPTYKKILDCLGLRERGLAPVPGILGRIQPVADPTLFFGWQGNLQTRGSLFSTQTINTTICTLTIPEDCFYEIDATCSILSQGSLSVRSAGLNIVDAAGNRVWEYVCQATNAQLTGVGEIFPTPFVLPTHYMHLLANMTVLWVIRDAMTLNDLIMASITLRKLYADQV